MVSGSEVENQGYDFVINVIPVRLKDVTWQLSLNTSVTRNSVTKNERLNTLYNYLDGSGVVEGRPFSTFYSYEFDVQFYLQLDQLNRTYLERHLLHEV